MEELRWSSIVVVAPSTGQQNNTKQDKSHLRDHIKNKYIIIIHVVK
jgi:hypothetical protein